MERDGCIALIDNEQSLTYRQLDDAVEWIMRYPYQQGIECDQVVGIIAEYSAQTAMVIYGILCCGAVLLPPSPVLSMIRLHAMCRKAQVAHILYDPTMRGLAQVLAPPASNLLQALATSAFAREPWPVTEPQDPAYVLFTSGSTGEPKGMQVSHGDLANYPHLIVEHHLTVQDRATLYSPLFSDLIITTLFISLCVGASISVCRHTKSETLLRTAVVGQPNTVIKLTSAHLRLLYAAGTSNEQICTLMVDGEGFRRGLARKAVALFPQAVIYNKYGPTEATISCMVYRYTG